MEKYSGRISLEQSCIRTGAVLRPPKAVLNPLATFGFLSPLTCRVQCVHQLDSPHSLQERNPHDVAFQDMSEAERHGE